MNSIVLNDDLTVPEVFFYDLFQQVKDITPGMIPGVKYTLEMLCGAPFWDALTDGQKRIAGRCMVHMVETGMMPLQFAEGRHEYASG